MESDRAQRSGMAAVDVGIRGVIEAEQIIETTVGLRERSEIPDVLLFTLHPRTMAWGPQEPEGISRTVRQSLPKRLKRARIELAHVTHQPATAYHWPGQIVVYPVMSAPSGARSAVLLATRLEQVATETLRGFRVEALPCRETPLVSTLWYGGRQVGALGVREDRGMNAAALVLNLEGDHAPSRMLGLDSFGPELTTLREVLGVAPPRQWVAQALRKRFALVFKRAVDEAPEELVFQVCGPDPKCLAPTRQAAR